jgi:ParB family transcriptional regulator, chromosome partitioning protein
MQKLLTNFELALAPGSTKGAMKTVGASSSDLWKVAIDQLHLLPNFNVRIKDAAHKAHIRAIADSIKQNGFYQSKPLAGYVASESGENIIYITDGHCRYEAVQLAVKEGAQISQLPIVIAPPGTSIEDLTVGLVQTNSGKPLEPFEIGIVAKRLIGFSWDISKIASELSFTEKYITDLLLLMGADKRVRDMVQRGEVSAATAIEALHKYKDKAYEKLQQALDAAKGAGKDKLTRQHLPEMVFKKLVTKSAPDLYRAAREIKLDPGYRHIAPELRNKLDEILITLEAFELPSEGDSR